MNKWLRYSLVVVLVIALVLVRKFETTLFYDPFLEYFHGRIERAYYPEYDLWKVVLNVMYRYLLNSLISLLIIGLVFNKKSYVKFSAYVYVVFLLLLLPIYIYLVEHYFELGNNIGFYVRRFLIQPLLLLILLPALGVYKPDSQNRVR